MRTRTIFTVIAAISIVAAGCSSDDGTATTTSLSAPTTVAQTTAPTTAQATTPTTVAQPTGLPPTSYSEFRQQAATCGADTPAEAAEMTFTEAGDADVAGQTTITLNTSCGPITIVVDSDAAEETVNSFIFLAEQGYFDGTVSHRVLPGFMMQAGDPTATGYGGPGYSISDELPSDGFMYERGIVAMANAGPNTGGSQFFIMFGTADWLPASYSVFGRVVDGYDALDAIEQVPLGMSASGGGPPSTPLETVYIESVTVER